ncbi:hypothetical protein J2Y69_002083 [Microbacterium resistens]|uniref:Hydrolase n=1 Tax=Microbacterium resistens TaxID=156977 RepID=A0ABU1SD02_9MICO|nr:hydrolase [Microbacterium resistens]MDR6867480.1 hypothetical protein [Microbacterium resistens]
MPIMLCETCAVEHAQPLPEVCAICADERQWVPGDGQRWTTLEHLRETSSIEVSPLEAGGLALIVRPALGIGQRSIYAPAKDGGPGLLWDPVGLVTDHAVDVLRKAGGVAAVVASHPHMYGAQVSWAEALDAVVLVHSADDAFLARDDRRVQRWSGSREVVPGIALHTLGGHFPGAAVAVWEAGSDGEGSLLAGDTIQPKPDGRSVSFMRSFPNHIPLSAAVVRRVADAALSLRFRRIYGNLGSQVIDDGRSAIERSAERYIGWVSGEFDHLT